MQSLSIINLDLRLFYQNTQNKFNFLVFYITEFRQISSYDALEMMERYEDSEILSVRSPRKEIALAFQHQFYSNMVIDTSIERSLRVLQNAKAEI